MKRQHGLEQHEQTRPSARVVITLSALIAFGPMAINLYLPAFPSMALDLATGIHQVELTLSAYMFGLGIGPLIIGPLSDRYGRLPILALGTTLFTFAAILCATTNDIELLMAYRFIQAVGGSVAPIIARATVRDIYQGRMAASVLSLVQSVMLIAPVMAPIVGGYLLMWFDWRASFWMMATYSTAVMILYWLLISESHPRDLRVRIADSFAGYWQFLKHRRAIGYTLTSSLGFGGMYGFFTEAPFVFIQLYGMSPENFGLLFGAFVIPTMVCGFINSKVVMHVELIHPLRFGIWASFASGTGLVLLVLAGMDSIVGLTIGLGIYFSVLGFISVNAMSAALNEFPRFAGMAIAVFASFQYGVGGLTSATVGWLHDDTALPMVAPLAFNSMLALLALHLLVRPHAKTE